MSHLINYLTYQKVRFHMFSAWLCHVFCSCSSSSPLSSSFPLFLSNCLDVLAISVPGWGFRYHCCWQCLIICYFGSLLVALPFCFAFPVGIWWCVFISGARVACLLNHMPIDVVGVVFSSMHWRGRVSICCILVLQSVMVYSHLIVVVCFFFTNNLDDDD